MEHLKEYFWLGSDRVPGLSISQHWGVDKEAFEGNLKCSSEIGGLLGMRKQAASA